MAKSFKIISSPVFSWSKSIVYSLLCYQDKKCRPLEEEIISVINNSVKIKSLFLMATHLPCCTSSPLLCMHYRHTNRPFLSSLQLCYVFEDCSHIFSQLTLHWDSIMHSPSSKVLYSWAPVILSARLSKSVKLKPYQYQTALFNRSF